MLRCLNVLHVLAMNCEGAEDLGSRFVSHIKTEESVDSLMRRIDRVLDGTFSAGRLKGYSSQ